MSVPSLVSDTHDSSDTSPSKVAKSPSRFNAWMDHVKVMNEDAPPKEVIANFENFYRLEELPSVLQGPLPTPGFDEEVEFQHAVRVWASTLRPVEGDMYDILTELHTLALACGRVRKTANNNSKEHAQRRGIDDIIEIAFSMKHDRHSDFKTEERYRLAGLDRNPDAQSDILVTIPSKEIASKIRHRRLFFAKPGIADHLYWSTTTDTFSTIGFAGEFKKDDDDYNKNQVIMVLTTAQSQRKALSLKKSIIMGATGCRGRVQIYSSYWSSDGSLCIYAHDQTFDLTQPVGVIHLYIFFSKLEKHFQDTFTEELRQWNPPTEATINTLKWRSPDHVRKRYRSEAESSTGSGDGGRGGNDGPMEADGSDDDRFMEVMAWRNEVAGGGRKARAISCEGEISSMTQLQF